MPAASATPAHNSGANGAVGEERHERQPQARPRCGGATVEKPGTNFANISEGAPQRSKVFSVCLTQESGSIAMRHKRPSTR